MNPSALCCFCLVLFFSWMGSCVEFQECSVNGEITELQINDCEGIPCKLVIGSTANITVKFIPKIRSEVLTDKAYFMISDVEQDAVVRPNACNALEGASCPLREGVLTVYKAEVIISQDNPPVKADLVWMLKNEQDAVIVCFATAVRLTYGHKSLERIAGERANVKETSAEKGEAFVKTVGHPRQRNFRLNRA